MEKPIFCLLVCLVSHAGALPGSAPPEEMRGMWIVRFSLTSPQSIRNIVANAKKHHFNTLFVQARGRGDAWYRTELEPRAEALAGKPQDFDPLARMVAEAHKNGLKVHAWLNTYLTWTGRRPPKAPNHIVNAHPDWIARDKSNRYQMTASETVEGIYVQPSHPDVQEHLFRVFTDVARRYDLDGLHFDFVRYPRADYDFSDAALARFKAWMEPKMSEAGRAAVRADGGRLAYVHTFSKEWAEWRREQVSGLVQRIAGEVHRMKPWMQVSAAVFANVADAYGDKGQDWRRWLVENWLDAICPMAYSRDTETVARQIAEAVAIAGEKHVYAGIGSWRIPAAQTVEKIERARALGARGVNLFSYDGMTGDGRKMDYLDYLTRSSFASRAGVPGMRWRAPREPAARDAKEERPKR